MKRSAVNDEASTTTKTGKQQDSKNICLLLHAVDGVVPYMTPLLLQKYFPPEKVANHFVLGLAVRDTCIAPVYPNPNENNMQKKKKNKTVDLTKPCGYDFTSTVSIDKYLSGYNTAIVPSFDLYLDAMEQSKNDTVSIASSNKQVMVWTPNGRQALNPQAHAKASRGLEASCRNVASVSLYDVALDTHTAKRKRNAQERARDWLEHHLKHCSQPQQDITKVWAPILLHDDLSNEPQYSLKGRIKFVEKMKAQHSAVLSGYAIVGWPHIVDRTRANERLEMVMNTAPITTDVAVLATTSMTQILDAIRLGVNVIGTSLPTTWAKDKQAIALPNPLLEGNISSDTNKKQKVENADDSLVLDENGCIDMHNTKWDRDGRPLVVGCTCLACRDNKHSRSYIHHLVQAKEMLAEILLFGHNLHQLLLLCQQANAAAAIGQETLQEFCETIIGKCGESGETP